MSILTGSMNESFVHTYSYERESNIAQRNELNDYFVTINNRNIRLISQELNTITIPDSNKFDKIYYLSIDNESDKSLNEVIKLRSVSMEEPSIYIDPSKQAIVPRSVIIFASNVGLKVDVVSYIAICKEFENRVCGSGKKVLDMYLNMYLPPLDVLMSVLTNGHGLSSEYNIYHDKDISSFLKYTEGDAGKKIYKLISQKERMI